MCLQTLKIIKVRNVVLMDDNQNINNNLGMHLNGRNECPTMIFVDKSTKLCSCDDDDKCEELNRVHYIKM